MSKGKLKASYLKIVSLWVCISIIFTLAGCFGPSTPSTPVEISKNISLGNNLKTFSIKSDTLNVTGVSVSGYIKYEENGTISYDYWNTPNKGSISINGEEINVAVGIYNGGSGSNIVSIKSSGGSIQPAANGCDNNGSRRTFYADNLGYTTMAYAITGGNISYNLSSSTVSVTVTGLTSWPQSSLSVFSGKCSVSRLYTKKIIDASLTFNKSLPICTIGSGITGFSCYPCESNEITVNNVCQPCAEGQESYNNKCVDKCSESQVRDPKDGICKCPEDKLEINGQCFPKCRADQIRNEDNSCGCTPENEEIDGQCITECFLGAVRNPETKQCEVIQCLEGYTLINGVCTYVPVPTPNPSYSPDPEPTPTPIDITPDPSSSPCAGTGCPTPPPTPDPKPKPTKNPEPKPTKKPDENCSTDIQSMTNELNSLEKKIKDLYTLASYGSSILVVHSAEIENLETFSFGINKVVECGAVTYECNKFKSIFEYVEDTDPDLIEANRKALLVGEFILQEVALNTALAAATGGLGLIANQSPRVIVFLLSSPKVVEWISKVQELISDSKALLASLKKQKACPAGVDPALLKTQVDEAEGLIERIFRISGKAKVFNILEYIGRNFSFVGAIRTRTLKDITHNDALKAFQGTGLTPTGHFINRMKDARTFNLGLRTFEDLEAIFRKGVITEIKNEVGYLQYGNFEIILNVKNGKLITLKPL